MSDIKVGSVWLGKADSIRPNDRIKVTKIKVWEDGERNILFEYLDKLGAGSEREVVFLEQFEKQDMVNHPPHYKDASGVGCTEVVKHMMYFGGACFKYLYRCGNKWDDIGDLKKAVRCAELADDDRFITDESWLRAMYQVASHRKGNIQQAMFSIRCQQWGDVIESIKAEIVRLESE